MAGISGLPPPAAGRSPDGAIRQASDPLDGGARSVWYPFGGTCVMERGPYWIGVRCIPEQSRGPSGHRHNDQLSFELNIGGQDYLVDPGTGTYTADPSVRNLLRGTAAHSTLVPVGLEQNLLVHGRDGVFVLRDRTNARCIELAPGSFSGEHSGFGTLHRRAFALDEDGLTIHDEFKGGSDFYISMTLDPDVRPAISDSEVTLVTADTGTRPVAVSGTFTGPAIDSIDVAEGYGMFAPSHALRLSPEAGERSITVRIALV